MWLQYVTAGISVITLGMTILIKFNDLYHLPKEVASQGQKIDSIEKKVDAINLNLTAISALCEERHGKKSRARR